MKVAFLIFVGLLATWCAVMFVISATNEEPYKMVLWGVLWLVNMVSFRNAARAD